MLLTIELDFPMFIKSPSKEFTEIICKILDINTGHLIFIQQRYDDNNQLHQICLHMTNKIITLDIKDKEKLYRVYFYIKKAIRQNREYITVAGDGIEIGNYNSTQKGKM